MPELILKLADQILQTISFDKDEIKIGRARDNDIVIENLNISRYHVQIRQHNGVYYLKDNNSSNGTLVNGVKITKTEIIDGDVIGLGKYKIHFRNTTIDVKLGAQYNEIEHTVLSEPKVSASLEVTSGKLKGRNFPLTKFETTIGKAPDNDIVLLEDWLLAKQQATIIKQGNSEYQIIDKGGLRKIKINGNSVSRTQVLQNEDVIEFGSIRCVFRCEQDSPVAVGRVPEEIGDQSVIISTAAAPSDNPAEESSPEAAKLHELIFSSASAAINGERPYELEESHPISPFDSLPPVTPHPSDAAFSLADSVSIEGKSSSRIRRRNRRDRERLKNKSGVSSSPSHPSPTSNPSWDQLPPAPGPAPSTPSAPPPPTPPVADLEKEIKMWEAALKNPSLPIRKQAAKMLKSLTGKEYDVE